MNTKMSKRQRDLKAKLMAAIAMLLVSSIMMVSTTYAWFTLSTAPEVTGITTAVGANGNLEMALQPYTGASETIQSNTGDSVKLPLERNVTWGNLVDVSDNATYGMNNITLYPAQLNASTETKEGGGTYEALKVQPLATPVYGADGRVSTVEGNTITGAFDYTEGQFVENALGHANAKGVRAVGISSALSARALAYRTAVAEASGADARAKRAATSSLNNRGAGLADLAIKHALTPAATFTQEEIQPLKDAVADLSGVMNQISNALKNYIIADSIAGASDETYLNIVNGINAATNLAGIKAVNGAVVDATIEAMYTTLDAVITKVNDAKSALNNLTGNAIAWKSLAGPLDKLLDTSKMTVNGMTMTDIQAEGGKDELVNRIIAAKFKADLVMTSGAGAYADIADFCGDYSAAITINVTYGSLNDIPVDANMTARTTLNTTHLNSAGACVDTFSGGTDSNSATPISQFYGYIIDLAFRTNASGSYLQLQADAVDRIYAEGSSNPETMGGGASMTFTSDSDTFTQTAVKNLMENIRVVFFDTDSREIIGYARLDSSNVSTGTEGSVTMPLMLTTATGTAIVDDATSTNMDESVSIMELKQNQVHELSAMVYLDGTTIENEDVAADEAKSMSGTMNLQFSSSATLKPMEYSALMSEGTSNVQSYSPLNNVTVPTGYRAAVYTDNNGKIGIQLTAPSGVSVSAVNVKVGDADPVAATLETFNNQQGYVVNVGDGVTLNSNTPIVITVTEGASSGTTTTKYTVNATGTTDVTVVADPSSEVEAGEDVTITVTNATDRIYNVLNNGTVIGEVAAKSGENNGSKTFTIDNVAANVVITVAEKTAD